MFLWFQYNNNIPALDEKVAWRRPDDKPLSEPIVVILLTHICVTQSQWTKISPPPPWISPESDLILDNKKVTHSPAITLLIATNFTPIFNA